MNRTGLLIVAGLLVAASGLTAVRAEEPADEVRLLRAQNGLLKATIEARDKKIAELQEEIKKLKAEPAQVELEALRESLKAARERIAELEGQLAKVAPEPNEKPKEVRRFTLKDVAALATKEVKELQGARVMGPTVVRSIEPDKTDRDKYQVMVIDTSGGQRMPIGSRSAATAHWVGKRWVQVRCILQATEATALRLQRDDELNIAGDVEKVEITPATKDTFEVIVLYLKEVKAN
jgi:hypothetical protein